MNDANILIDLVKLQLLPHFFVLGWEYHTTSLVFDELFEDQQEAFAPYRDMGLFLVADLDAPELLEILELQIEKPQLSEQDCSALFYTIKSSGVLLSSDRILREFAENKGVEVHGHLWILDEMVAQNCISPSHAADALEGLINTINPKLRLPDHECKRRLGLWRRGLRIFDYPIVSSQIKPEDQIPVFYHFTICPPHSYHFAFYHFTICNAGDYYFPFTSTFITLMPKLHPHGQ